MQLGKAPILAARVTLPDPHSPEDGYLKLLTPPTALGQIALLSGTGLLNLGWLQNTYLEAFQ